MKITCTSRETKSYRPLFAKDDLSLDTAVVEFDVDGEVTTMGFSHRGDDPDGMWLADWRIESWGGVAFSHGDGDRSCSKQIAGDVIVEEILRFTS